ncbi:inactive peptidyl-prolyl cis-trans isomerase shutdown [Sitophilus oryzae]|uniref:peptidylprolyl isomerase n=1 Tax=Sitophilus oryzae TaxID=7048 RepID=A0A6J2YIP7_SITOR|nr:inactive peptidyl-prolyl cis-trans isomerase shutdown [Sitophilus oryzae]
MLPKINLKELTTTGTTFHIDPVADIMEDDSDDEVSKDAYETEMLKHAKMECMGEFEDEDVYDPTEPFETFSSKMTNLIENGDIKKRVLREGYGDKPEDKSIVKVHYNAYTEHNAEPFDCTYGRKKPHIFTLGQGEVIPGLDIAVASMKINEKSQFLVKPAYAYGEFGCMDRIPPNSSVLFEIELIEIIESSAAEHYENLPQEKRTEFSEVYKYCMSQCAKAKDLFGRSIISAIKQYNMAVSALENAVLSEYEDQVKQQELLYKLYSNLLVCYTKVEEPKKACINFNKINQMVQGSDMKISAKAYYNNAKCLRMLGDYSLAKRRLQCAYKLNPKNPEILQEFKIIDEKQRIYKEKEQIMASAFINSKNKETK